MSRWRIHPGFRADAPRGLPTAGRVPIAEGGFAAALFRLFRPHPSDDVRAQHRPDPVFSRGLWKARKGWRGRLVAGE